MEGPAVSFVLLRPLVGFCPDGFGRPQALAQGRASSRKTAPLDVIVNAAGSVSLVSLQL